MRQSTFDDLVLQWVESLQVLSQDSRCRVLQRTCDSLKWGGDDEEVASKTQAMLQFVRALPDVERLRLLALSVARESSTQAMEKNLSSYCTLTLYVSHRSVQRFTSASKVAEVLVAQNTIASANWFFGDGPQAWVAANIPRTIDLCTIFVVDSGEKAFSFYDRFSFDIFGQIEHMDRTLIVGCPSNEEDVRMVLKFGSQCV